MEMQTNCEGFVFPTMNEGPQEIIFRNEEDEDDLAWELVNCSDSDADDVISLSDDSWHPSSSCSEEDSPILDLIQDFAEPDHDYEPFHDGYAEPYIGDQEDEVVGDGYDYDEEEEEEEEEDNFDYEEEDGYDLDDELVPRALSGKFGRQRMRKLGKRAFAKMNSSRKSPFLYMKPGCVRGKHGLGLKHSF